MRRFAGELLKASQSSDPAMVWLTLLTVAGSEATKLVRIVAVRAMNRFATDGETDVREGCGC